MRVPALLALAGVLALGWGCTPNRITEGGDGAVGGDGGVVAGALTLTPASAAITLTGQNQVVKFKAIDPTNADVTSSAAWTLSDPAIGTVTAGAVTVLGALQQGGTYTVTATNGLQSGSATLVITASLPDIIDPSAPTNAPVWFNGPTATGGPQLSYPFDNTFMAPNVLQVVLNWSGANALYRIQMTGATYRRAIYVKCSTSSCSYPVADAVWSGMSHSALGEQVQLVVSSVTTQGGPVSVGAPTHITFSPDDIKGGLYYFSPTITGIKRVPLGASAPVDFINQGDGTGCAGCHSVSRDGKQVAVEFGSGQTQVGSTVVNGTSPNTMNFPLSTAVSWNFSWFNPAGDKLITNWSGTLIVRDPKTGQALSQITPAQIGGSYGGAMPEWSPDGNWIAFVRETASSQYDFELNSSGDIVIMPYNNGSFGPAVELVHGDAGGDVHFWPSWSPDSKWIVFDSQTCNGSCDSYNATQTRLRLVRAINDAGQPAVGSKPIDLLAGTHMPNNTNNWPKFAPFLQGQRYVFVVYSAKYGWGDNAGSNPQLFMFGIDLQKAATGADPSFQPVWLPFQDRTTGNHSAIWTTDVVCTMDSDCPAEFVCTGGMCSPNIG